MVDNLAKFYQAQLERWPLAKNNFDGLAKVLTREVSCGGFPVTLQFNPGRIRSTAAKVDTKSIAERKCFLCSSNRPHEQLILNCIKGFDFLVNPFPIFERHFTIASKEHIHQDKVNFEVAAEIAMSNPGYAVFYNGSKSGASAPDHLHFQAVLRTSLPLLQHLSDNPGAILTYCDTVKVYDVTDYPANAIHIISRNLEASVKRWIDTLLPLDENGLPDKGKRNLFFWEEDGLLHTLLFPRLNHRPECYFADGDKQFLVSPGAIDMAGVIILPRLKDFERLDAMTLTHIFDQVSYNFHDSEAFKHLLLT